MATTATKKTAAKKTAKKTASRSAPPRASMIEKEPTQLHQDFADWLEAETGYKPDIKSVQLATVLRMDFQRSDRNQQSLEARRQAKIQAEQDREKRRQDRAAKKTAPAKKTAAKKSSATPAKKASAPAKKTAAKKAPARRRATRPSSDESFE
jgi:hypothetical protein